MYYCEYRFCCMLHKNCNDCAAREVRINSIIIIPGVLLYLSFCYDGNVAMTLTHPPLKLTD